MTRPTRHRYLSAAGRELLTIGAAAEVTGVTTRTVQRWLADDRLPSRRIGVRRVHYIDPADLPAVAPHYRPPPAPTLAAREVWD